MNYTGIATATITLNVNNESKTFKLKNAGVMMEMVEDFKFIGPWETVRSTFTKFTIKGILVT